MSATENIARDDLALNNLALGARLRIAELADVQAMHRMETILFPVDAWHIDMFLEELTLPTRTYYILELPTEGSEDNEGSWRAVGYCGTMVVADTADVQTIGVVPEYEGHGYGRTMLEQMHERAREQGAERILLEVRADNPRAQRLYERSGYRAIHVRRGYYDDGTDAIIMECTF